MKEEQQEDILVVFCTKEKPWSDTDEGLFGIHSDAEVIEETASMKKHGVALYLCPNCKKEFFGALAKIEVED